MTARVLVVGAVNVDVVVTALHLPGPGETVVGPGAARHGGGKGANAAVAAARAGAEVRYCGAVGDDDAGREALAELRAEGVDLTDVAVLDGVPTGTALIVVDRRGENQIAVGSGANAAVPPEVTRAAVQRAAGWAGCVLVSTEIPTAAVAAALEAATGAGMRCVLNPAPVTDGLAELLPLGPVVTPNASELADLSSRLRAEAGGSVADMAAGVLARTGAPVVVTLGGDGALVVGRDGTSTALPALRPTEVRDTTGAGDTFNGVLATALAAGPVDVAGGAVVAASARGVAAASLSVERVGARAGMPREDAIDAAEQRLTEVAGCSTTR
ncbi:PfkB family carbohydrate kinase [Actinomycetospora sp. TBRC 11914]|uniref:PfkB family carbohydrate kinase n=1 Tax=Actinomycetospora sp. TBRC 11914 TaxID=2729387 RepID=UPI00145EBEA4|nr:PfkB family carbohydrate kinase [Actinomycetospora sp. TBRC 11914]NMO94033.1 ribokinase [Actinomycetospora sp. TBRC 11914]